MILSNGIHLAYCTNIHRGETWPDTLANLERHTLAVRRQVAPDSPYGIGLRLGDRAATELSDRVTLKGFQKWLAKNNCYIFTINGFPFGQFHGTRVKERVYLPDWTSPERLDYTNRLFDLLTELVPQGVEGSVSTLPGSFKRFIQNPAQEQGMRDNLWRCVEYIAKASERTGRKLHLGLEPEPLCYLETSQETVDFFETLRAEHPNDPRLAEHLGVNYDTCHLAVEFEEPASVIDRFRQHHIKISKLHLSSALRVRPTAPVRAALAAFTEDTYLHQVVVRDAEGSLTRCVDLDVALNRPVNRKDPKAEEWRIHFHVPLHSRPAMFFDPGTERDQLDFNRQLEQSVFDTTSDHLLGVLDYLGREPSLCSHLEMETYTWEVLPPELKNRHVVDQLVAEYAWTLRELALRDIVATRIPLDRAGDAG